MVKKINNRNRPATSGAKAVDSTKSVKTSKIDSSKQVDKTVKNKKASKASTSTRSMTLEDREELFNLVQEEAEKMFKKTNISESKRKTVETAVKMAIDSSLQTEEIPEDQIVKK